MALNFSFVKVKRNAHIFFTSEEEKETGQGWYYPMADALIWLCMMLDMQGITSKNVDEFWFRLTVWRMMGSDYFTYVEDWDKEGIGVSPWEITKQDIERMVGLSTNVSQKTRRQFLAKQMRILTEGVERSNSDYPSPIFSDADKRKFDKARQRVLREWKQEKLKKDMERANEKGLPFTPTIKIKDDEQE